MSELSPNSLEVVYEKSIHADSESSVSTIPPAPSSAEKTAEKPLEARCGRWMENSESSTCLVCGRAFGWLRRRHVGRNGRAMRHSIAGSAVDWCAARAASSEPICRSLAIRAKCECVFNAMESEARWLRCLRWLRRLRWLQWLQWPRLRCEVFVLKQKRARVPSEPDRSIHNRRDSIPTLRALLP